MKLTIISSSVREGRQSDQVAYAIMERATKKGISNSSVLDLAKMNIPHMSNSFGQTQNPGEDLTRLNSELMKSDFMILVSPEYNGTYTAQLKNALDYFPKSHFQNKAIGICSVSSGPLGGMRGAINMQQLVLALWAFPIPNMLLVSNVDQKFDQNRSITDKVLIENIDQYLEKLIWFSEALISKKSE